MPRRRQVGRAAALALVALSLGALLQALAPPAASTFPARPALSALRVADPQQAHRDRAQPAPRMALGVPPGRPALRVPILMYHYIRVNPNPSDQLGFNLSVTPIDFASQIDWLARNAYHPVDSAPLRRYVLGT